MSGWKNLALTTAPPPAYKTNALPIERQNNQLPGGKWDFATTISSSKIRLSLDREGNLFWQDYTVVSGKSSYERDGFIVSSSQSRVVVTKQPYTWSCEHGTKAALLLQGYPANLTLDHFGKNLVIFQRTIIVRDWTRPPPKYREDERGSLQVEKTSHGVFCFTGPDIAQIKGDERALAIQSRCYLRLFDVDKNRLRWETFAGAGTLVGLTEKYVVQKVGDYHLYERPKGYRYGQFASPVYRGLIALKEEDAFGPMLSRNGLLVHKTCKKALFVFDIGDNTVRLRIWESSQDIEGSLAVRGDLENLEVRLIGQDLTWIQHEQSIWLQKNWDPIKKYLLKM